MKIKSKSKFVVGIIVILLIAIIVVSFIVMVVKSLVNNEPIFKPGPNKGPETSQTNNEEGEKGATYLYNNYKEEAERLSEVPDDKVTAPPDTILKNFEVAKIKDQNLTLIFTTLTNNGTTPIAPGTVYNLSFYDQDGQFIMRIGAVVEGVDPVAPGASTRLRTQVLGDPGDVGSVVVEPAVVNAPVEEPAPEPAPAE